jgi:hypothetical protein
VRFLATDHGGLCVVHLSRRPVLFLLHLIISAVHFKSDGQKSRIPLRLSYLLKSLPSFLDINP